LVRKRSGRLEPFSAEKLAAGVSAALTDRRVAVGSLERLVSEVEAEVINSGSPIDSHRIGVWVLERLRRLDEVAYLRFASVYKDFQVAGDFEREMAALEKNGH
jgi:transcriptional repressor NrdR